MAQTTATQEKRRARYSPIDPVALGSTTPCPNASSHDGAVVTSAVVGDNADLIREAARLWIAPEDVVVDATYGRGAFWKNMPEMPTHKHDLMYGDDLRSLPHGDSSVDVLVLDPPYRPTHGSKGFGGNGLAQAYQLGTSSVDTITDVLDLYDGGIREAYRLLKPGGRIMVKCQDLSYGHRLHLVTLDVMRSMIDAGFDMVDQFVLVNQTRLSSAKWARQERARRSHSILWVAVK